MKKFVLFALTLALGASILVGCGCMNTGNDVTTLPTNGETAAPTTHAATAPTTVPATMPTTAPTTEAATDHTTDTTGIMDDIVGGSTDDTTVPADAGRGRSFGNGPRFR